MEQNLPISIYWSSGGRTFVSVNKVAQLLVSADIPLILALVEGSDETVDDLGLVSSQSETAATSEGLIVDIFEESLCLRQCDRTYCFHQQLE